MSKRPRSHVIEDIAAAQFTLAMQPRWIVRTKDKDYGVDLEAELLTEDDTATGNIFYVQSKATDDEGAAQSVQMKVDRIQYLASFEIPAMIVRYSEPTKSNFWMWATEAQTFVQPGAQTVTLKFDERHRWTDNTVAEIERTLPILRVLKRSDPRIAFPLRPVASVYTPEAIVRQRVVDLLAKDLSFMHAGLAEVPISFSIVGSTIDMSIERIVSASIVAESNKVDDLLIATGYLYADLLRSLDQRAHARRAAKWCLSQGKPAPTSELAARVAIALLEHADAAVDLAILNGLHADQNFGHSMFRMVLHSPFVRTEGMETAVHRFYLATIEAHEQRGEPIGAIRYSYANYLVSLGDRLGALQQFNQARRDEPEYWSRPYFLRELGGLFFLKLRYRASARAYRCAVDIEPTLRSWFCLGDAELYSGAFPAAMKAFDYATSSDGSHGAEARLKIGLAAWALQAGVSNIGDWNTIHPIREYASSTGALHKAFWSHLALAFLFEDDVACWADAIFLALCQQDTQLLEDVLFLSVQRTRLEGYAQFKENRKELLVHSPKVADELDRLALIFREKVDQ